jgi:hypothetical protein
VFGTDLDLVIRPVGTYSGLLLLSLLPVMQDFAADSITAGLLAATEAVNRNRRRMNMKRIPKSVIIRCNKLSFYLYIHLYICSYINE